MILETKVPNLHIAPSEPDLAVAEILMQNRRNKSFILRQMILDIYNNKYINISPPPETPDIYIIISIYMNIYPLTSHRVQVN